MKRTHTMGALVLAATSLLATGVFAQNPHASPDGKENAAAKAEKAADKAGKAADKADKATDKAKSVEDRAARKAKEHAAQRDRLKGMLKAPMAEPMKQELRRHAERLARLERIKEVALAEKDTATLEKASSLIAKENERHERWMSKHAAAPAAAGEANGGAK